MQQSGKPERFVPEKQQHHLFGVALVLGLPTGGKTCLLLGAYRTARTDAWLVGEEMG
jgi:hypothetical protein